MRAKILFTLVLASLLLAACNPGQAWVALWATPEPTLSVEEQVSLALARALAETAVPIEIAAPTEESVPAISTPTPTTTPNVEVEVAAFPKNTLVNPKLFDAGEDPAGEADSGFFDIGVNPDQVGIVFGWDLSWNGESISGEGCEIVVLSGGWYENFNILDGRYEIYTLPSSDPAGWTQVLIDQRVAEQATHYGCDSNAVPPVWEGGE